MVTMKYVAMATFASLHYQLPLKQDVILKAYNKMGYIDLRYLLSSCYNIYKTFRTNIFLGLLFLACT